MRKLRILGLLALCGVIVITAMEWPELKRYVKMTRMQRMHELGICEGLVDLIERRAAGRRVTGARVRVGARHAVTEKAFGQAFAIASEGTAAAGAAVDVVITPASVDCRACGRWSETLDPVAACAYCGATDVEVSGGDELVLESLRFAEPGWRTAAPGEAPVPGEGEHRVSRHPR